MIKANNKLILLAFTDTFFNLYPLQSFLLDLAFHKYN